MARTLYNHKYTHCSSELPSIRGTWPELNLATILVRKSISQENVITAPCSNFEIFAGRKARGVYGWIGRRQRDVYKGIFTTKSWSFLHYLLIPDGLPVTIASAWTNAWWRRKQKENKLRLATSQEDVAFCNTEGTSPGVPLG